MQDRADRLRDEAYKALGSGLKAYQYSTGKNYEAQTNLLTNFAEKVAYNSKELKANVIYHYNLLVDYINIMAQVKKTKLYTDLQARGTKGKKNDKAEKVEK